MAGGIIGLRDCQSEVIAQRAANTLAAGSQVLVRSEREAGPALRDVPGGGGRGRLLTRVVRATRRRRQHSVEKVASSIEHREYVESIKVDWGSGPLGMGSIG